MRSVVTQKVFFQAGHVIINPHMHDYTVEVAVSREMSEYDIGVNFLVLRDMMMEIGSHLAHRMIAWKDESPRVLGMHCDVPKGMIVPAEMPYLWWSARPTIENMTFWFAQQIRDGLREIDPKAAVEQVHLRETSTTGCFVAGRDLGELPLDNNPVFVDYPEILSDLPVWYHTRGPVV